MLCLIISYVFSSTQLEKNRAEKDLPESEGSFGGGAGGRNGPNNVYTYE
jgi:hypothetical protein